MLILLFYAVLCACLPKVRDRKQAFFQQSKRTAVKPKCNKAFLSLITNTSADISSSFKTQGWMIPALPACLNDDNLLFPKMLTVPGFKIAQSYYGTITGNYAQQVLAFSSEKCLDMRIFFVEFYGLAYTVIRNIILIMSFILFG